LGKFTEFLTKPFTFNSNPSKDATLTSRVNDPAAWFIDALGGASTLSGQNVNHESAMELDSYFAAVRNISEDVAKLPLNIYEKIDGGKILTSDHFAQTLLHDYANPNMSSMDLFQTMLHWSLSYGNGYAEIVRNGKGEAVEMWPIHPSRVTPIRDENQNLYWEVRGEYSTVKGTKEQTITLHDDDMFNLRGIGNDGILGYRIYDLASDSIGQGLAVQKFASTYFKNGTAVSGILSMPGSLDKKAYTNLRDSWAKTHEGGSYNKHKIAIIEGGGKFEPTTSTAQAAQLLESQRFTVERMARLLRIPPHKIGHNTGLVKANFEAENIAYFRDTLTPWIKRHSLETNRKIIKDKKYTAKYVVNALTLGDSKTRSAVEKTYLNMGVMSINDVRILEDQNVLKEDWANKHYMQSNMTTVDAISDGDNLKDKGSGQMGKAKLEQGENDVESSSQLPEMDSLQKLVEVKKAHLPSFKYAAKRVIVKESKMMNNKLKSFMADSTGFEKWVDPFFDKQKADIIDVFSPCCEVLFNTSDLKGIQNTDFLSDFADKYAEDGKEQARNMWESQSKGDVIEENIEETAEKMANSMINLIAQNSKGAENEDN
jgi:HK97 family phage portal protein